MRPSVMLAPYLLLAAFVAGGYLWHVGDMKSGQSPYDSGEATVGGPFTLTDQNGVIRRDEEFRGKFMLVFFGFTYCPDICPTTMIVLKEALEKIGGKADRVVPIFISVDPERDTPAVLKPYLATFSPRFVGLTGSVADVTAATRAYRVYFQKKPQPGGSYSMDHSSIIYLMGTDGKYITHYTLEQGPDAIAEDLARRL
jgi:cytochrome oxidase Cu insertion factor (SCO1/SenC/PrrC family)